MPLPTPDNLKTMDYAFQAQPFVDVPSKSNIDLKTMDWVYQAQPFVRNYGVIVTQTYYQNMAATEVAVCSLLAARFWTKLVSIIENSIAGLTKTKAESISKYAAYHTAITTGYTNPSNAYADDGVYATAAPAKNAQVSAYFGFPAFSTDEIPNGATINSVTTEFEYYVSTTASIATQYWQTFNGTTGLETEQSDASEPLADVVKTHTVTSGITLSDLRNADTVRMRLRSARGNSNTAVTFYIDYVKITVDYTEPAAGQTYYQNLFVTGVSIITLSTALVLGKLLSVVENSIISLSKIVSHFRSLIVTEVSNVAMSLAKTFYRILSVIESSITSLVKGMFSTLSVIESSIVSLTTAKFFSKFLSVVEASIASISRIVIYVRSLIVTEVSSVILSIQKTFLKTLAAVETSMVSLSKGFFKTLSALENSLVSLTTAKFFLKVLAAVESSIATISRAITFLKTLAVTEISIAGLTKISTFFKNLAVIEVSISSLNKIVSYFRNLIITEVSIPSLEKAASYLKTLAATSVSVVFLITAKTLSKTLSVIQVSVIAISKNIGKKLFVSMNSVVSLIKEKLTGASKLINAILKISPLSPKLKIKSSSSILKIKKTKPVIKTKNTRKK